MSTIALTTQTNEISLNIASAVKKALRPLLVILAVVLLFTQVFRVGIIVTGSMSPTILPGDFFFSWCLGDMSKLERGTVIDFHHERFEGDERFGKDELLSKRIIGLPGETIEFWGGSVWINGQLLDEPYLPEGTITVSIYNGMFTIPEDCYFVMGDNREHSWDSRYWDDPFVRSDQIQNYQLTSFTVPGLSRMLAQNAYNTGSKLPADAASPITALLRAALSCPAFLVPAAVVLLLALMNLCGLVDTLWTGRSLAGLIRSGEIKWAAGYAMSLILVPFLLHKLALFYLIGD